MGEIADMLLDGTLDFYTGEYMGRGKGIPRTTDKSLPWEQRDFTRSKKDAFKGVSHFVRHRMKVTDITPIVNEYMPDKERSLKQKCLAIQKNWGAFVKWINDYKSNLNNTNQCKQSKS